jgi:GDP-D-mannose dehydratase
MRPFDSPVVTADPTKARIELGWSATVRFPELIRRLCESRMSAGAGHNGEENASRGSS